MISPGNTLWFAHSDLKCQSQHKVWNWSLDVTNLINGAFAIYETESSFTKPMHRSSPSVVFLKKGVLKNAANLQEETHAESHFNVGVLQ